jgi:hypothetical protein
MPSWASAAITTAPWAVVAIVAITVVGRLLAKALGIAKIRIMRAARSPTAVYESKYEQWMWVSPDDGDAQPSRVEPPAKPQLRSVSGPGPTPIRPRVQDEDRFHTHSRWSGRWVGLSVYDLHPERTAEPGPVSGLSTLRRAGGGFDFAMDGGVRSALPRSA